MSLSLQECLIHESESLKKWGFRFRIHETVGFTVFSALWIQTPGVTGAAGTFGHVRTSE